MSERTVLVVDDEEAIAEAVRARLESEGFRVVVATDGPQAIEKHPDEPLHRGGLTIDPSRRLVEVDGEEIALTPLEFEILFALARDPGVVFAREQLMERVWGYRDFAGGRVVDSHVARIRRKLGEDGNE